MPSDNVDVKSREHSSITFVFQIESTDLTDKGFTAFVHPFVTFEGTFYNGTRSKVAVDLPKPSSQSSSEEEMHY